MTFIYEIENNGVKVPLECQCDYDYCTDTGASAYLEKAMLGGWDLSGPMTQDEREEIEQFYLDHLYQIEQDQTSIGIQEAHKRGEHKI
jgi:hypothetical protein